GCLIAADEDAKVFAVTEVLAANRYSDAALVRISGGVFKPLPLNTNVYPGDQAFCYSDPLEHRGYFSQGVINRFYLYPGRRTVGSAPSAAYAPMRINVGTDWAPGSSVSAVVEECGNAIGPVSTIAASVEEDPADAAAEPQVPLLGMIVFHEAVS